MTAERFSSSFFGPSTLVNLLRHRALYQPEAVCYTYLADGENEELHLTNAELDRQARAIAARLQGMGLEGERAVLLYPPGLDFIAAFFGCLYANVVAVPAYPPRMNRSLYRIQVIAADAEAKVALTTRGVLERVETMLEEESSLHSFPWVPTDDLPAGLEQGWKEPRIDAASLAFLQYTSGSTGTPKGVMLTHGNLLHNSALISHCFEHTRTGTGVFWLPSYHDMGLIGGILQPLYVGRPNILMSPMSFLQRPIRWLRAITKYRGSTSGGPNFAYELAAEKVTEAQIDSLDLSSWNVAFNGAEPVRAETLDRFYHKFKRAGFRREAFYPCYGLAEGTLIVTGGYRAEPPVVRTVDGRQLEAGELVDSAPDAPHARQIVGSGHSLPDQELVVVDPQTLLPQPEGKVGEIWVRGPSIAVGYWSRPDESVYTFGARLADADDTREFLRTGDMGVLSGGELFVTGRIKDLIIVRGVNHYPQDIELTAERAHAALRGGAGAAFSVEREGGKQELVLVQEVERGRTDECPLAISTIRRDVAAEHELPLDHIVLIRAGSIPKTSSGKIQRHACRRAFLDGTLTVVAQWPGDVELVDVPTAPSAAEQHAEQPSSVASPPELVPESSEESDVAAEKDAEPSRPAGEEAPLGNRSVAEVAAVVFEEVRRIAQERAKHVSLESSFGELGMDSLERIELQAALEDRFGGRMPEDVGPELETMRQVVEAVRLHLGENAQTAAKVPVEQIPPENYRFECAPEYVRLKQNLDMLEATGLGNPYFNVHQRVTNDTTQIEGRELINFSSYNYLGMSGDPAVSAAAKEAIDRFGTSVSASRLVSGEKTLHRELEQALADWVGADDAIVFVGGHSTNETTIGHLFGAGDLILHDALAHNSIVQGSILSGARRRAFPHNDWESLDRLLHDMRGQYRRVLIAIEGVYSMDGDYPDLPKFIEVKRRHKAFLMVDEAHSVGVMGERGRGIGEHFGVDTSDVDLWMGTLSKAMGSCGGYIAGSKAVVQYLKYTAPGFVYSVGLSPSNAAAALASLQVLKGNNERVTRLRERSRLFLTLAKEAGLNTGLSHDSPVVPIILGNSVKCLQLSRALNGRNVNVQPILYPAVEESAARLRFFITSNHTEPQIRYTVQAVAEELQKIEAAWAQASEV